MGRSALTINVVLPIGKIKDEAKFKIPPLEAGETYRLDLEKIAEEELRYKTEGEEILTISRQQYLGELREGIYTSLSEEGEWWITPRFEEENLTYKTVKAIVDRQVSTNKETRILLPVRSKSELLSVKIQEETLTTTKKIGTKSAILMGVIGLATIIMQITLAKWQINKTKKFKREIQVDLLKGIKTQLEIISQDEEEQKKDICIDT
ncbi:MAG: hypothetical protein ABIB71_02620, partial [Candidatus Woesearchaeota archaeon]